MKITKAKLKQVIEEQVKNVTTLANSKKEVNKLVQNGFKVTFKERANARGALGVGSIELRKVTKSKKANMIESFNFSTKNGGIWDYSLILIYSMNKSIEFYGEGTTTEQAKDAAEKKYDQFLSILGLVDSTLRV